jgi:transposase
MIQLSPQLKIFVALDFCDFRKGIDSLVFLCRNKLQNDPYSGALFLFKNRSSNAIKILCYDGSGFWLLMKRFSKGRLQWWPENTGQVLTQIAAKELGILIYNGIPERAKMPDDWRKLTS